MKLVYEKTGALVKVGDEVELRFGLANIIDIVEPHKPSSTGRVYVEYKDGNRGGYFPSVIDAKWIERGDR